MMRLVIAEPAKKTEPRRLLPATLPDPLRGAHEDVTEALAVVRSAPLDPPKTGRLARVGYGFALPLAVMRALVRDPLERRRIAFFSGSPAFIYLFAPLSQSPPPTL